MDRIQSIDTILKDLYLTVKEDGKFLDRGAIYNYLIKRDVPVQYNNININGVNFDYDGQYENKSISSTDFFSRWIKRFNYTKNIDVFCDPNWRYFCQFKNGDFEHVHDDRDLSCIKMYIPLDYEHLYEGVNRIFDFLSSQNICHLSKVSSRLRFDDVVVRLPNLEDAKKLQNFLDNDSYIQEGLMKSNSFAFNNNGIAYAMDGMLSYNSFLSSLLNEYINEMVNNSSVSVNNINIYSFLQYVRRMSNDFSLIETHLSDRESASFYKDEYIVDGYGAVKLIELALTSNDMNKFYEHYYYLNNKRERQELVSMVKGNRMKLNKNPKEELIQDFILTTMKKYPIGYDNEYPNSSGLNYIFSYLKGNDKAVTRDFDLRNRMKNEIMREDVFQIINDSNIIGKDMNEKIINYVKLNMLNEIISCMIEKFGDGFSWGIEQFMNTNDLKYITKSVGNARSLAKTFTGSGIRHFLRELGMYNLEEYMDNYYYVENRNYGRR